MNHLFGGINPLQAFAQTSEIVAEQIQFSLERFKAVRGRGQMNQPGTVSIAVYFHVINEGPGLENGDVPTRVLRDQIEVLNNSYSGQTGGANTPFRFELPRSIEQQTRHGLSRLRVARRNKR